MTVIKFQPYLLDKHIQEIDARLEKGKVKEAENYIASLPINIRIKINMQLKNRYVKDS